MLNKEDLVTCYYLTTHLSIPDHDFGSGIKHKRNQTHLAAQNVATQWFIGQWVVGGSHWLSS